MKNSIKTIVFALALITTAFTANAEDKESKKPAGFDTGIYTTKTGRINVIVNKATLEGATTILLKNEKGDVIYREIVGKKEQKFGRTLNLDELETGKYEIEVRSLGETQSKSFELSDQRTERILTVN